jgi:hypothetical protein
MIDKLTQQQYDDLLENQPNQLHDHMMGAIEQWLASDSDQNRLDHEEKQRQRDEKLAPLRAQVEAEIQAKLAAALAQQPNQ